MKQRLLFLSLVVMLLGLGVDGWGQFSIEAGSTDYNQDFNTLTNGTWTNNTTLVGWYAKTDATASITTYGANTGSTTTAGLYAFGVSGTNPLTDRALGYAPSNGYTGAAGTGKGYLGWRLKNNTGSSITSITVKWTGEQWRKENNASSHTMNLFYQIGATVTDLTSGTWTTASSTFTSPISGATTATALDGNATANRVVNITVTINLTIPDGQEIMLRWDDLNDSGNDHLMAIDDVSINSTIEVSATPSINVGTITDFGSHQINTTSSEKTYNVSGSNLTDDVIITPPTGFLISSISGSGYSSNPITLNHTDGTLESTPIYVVFNPTTAQAYSGNISHVSEDATTKNVAVSGTGTNPPPPDAPVATDATEIGTTYFTANWGSVSGANGYKLDVYQNDITNLITTGFEGSTDFPSGWTQNSSYVQNNSSIAHTGTYYAGMNAANDYFYTTLLSSPTTISFWIIASSATANNTTKVQYSSNAVDWTDLATYVANGSNSGDVIDSWSQKTINASLIGNYYLRWFMSARTGGSAYFDDIIIDGGSQTFVSGYEDRDVESAVSYIVTGLVSGETYYYKVRSTNSNGTSQNSNEIEVTTAVLSTFTGTGNWSTSERWSDGIPGSTTNVTVNGTVTVDGTVMCNNLTISTSGAVTVTAGQGLAVNGDLLIQSSDAGTGSFIGAADDYTITGSTTLQRYLTNYSTGGDNKYHLLSSPVSTQPIQPEFVANSPAADVDFYKFDEPTATWINTKTEANAWNAGFESNFVVGRGYLVAYPNTPVTKSFTGGTLNSYSSGTPLVITCTNTNAGGWNLIGNPFPSAIDWDLVQVDGLGDGMDAALYYYDHDAANYRYYVQLESIGSLGSGSRYIPAMQGFMVHAKTSGTKTVSLHNGHRVHSTQAFYKSQNEINNLLTVKLQANGKTDEAYILYFDEATESFDGKYDAYKLFSYAEGMPQLYTFSADEAMLAINTLPTQSDSKAVALGYKAPSAGSQTMSFEGLTSFAQPGSLQLEDKLLGIMHTLNDGSYEFVSEAGTVNNRFVLHFGAVGISEQPASATLKAYVVGAQLFFPLQGEATLEIVDLQGRVLQQSKVSGQGLASQPLQLPSGVYVVRLTSGLSAQTAKVIVK